jgi:phage shock protein A
MFILSRLRNLVRGIVGQWLGRRERENPEAVYEAAIQERLERYAKLREAAAGVLYARTKLARETTLRSDELGHVRTQLDIAVERDDDAAALLLIGRRDTLTAEVDRLTAELTELTTEAEAAKKNLVAFQREIARLRDEKVRMIARLANARARLRLQETLSHLSPDADIRALEAVREHVNRLVAEAALARDAGDPELEQRLGHIRDAEAAAAARAQLDELKRTRKRALVPLVLPQATAAS